MKHAAPCWGRSSWLRWDEARGSIWGLKTHLSFSALAFGLYIASNHPIAVPVTLTRSLTLTSLGVVCPRRHGRREYEFSSMAVGVKKPDELVDPEPAPPLLSLRGESPIG